MAEKVILSIREPEQALQAMLMERFRMTEFLWKTADGSAVNIRDMTDDHLNNTIGYLRRAVSNKEVCLENEAEALNND